MPRPPEIGNVQLFPDRPLKAADRNGYVLKFYCPIRKRRIRKNCGTRDRRDARRILRECRERLLNGKYVESGGAITDVQEQIVSEVRSTLTPLDPSAMSWQDCYERYRDHQKPRVRERSLAETLSRITIAERILEGQRQDHGLPEGGPVGEYLTLEALEYLQDRLLAGDEGRFGQRAPTTVNSMIVDVMTFMRYCCRHGWIERVPHVTKLTVDDAMKGRPVTPDEFDAMLEAIPAVVGKGPAASWEFTLRILWESAFRIGDVMDFSWDDTRRIYPKWPAQDGQHPTLMIPPTQKNGKSQEIPMLPGLHELLQRTPASDRQGWVINPQPIDYQIRSSEAWFRPTDADLAAIAGCYSNCAIARACGVTGTSVRNWLSKILGDSQRTRSTGSRDIPSSQIAALRKRAQQRDAQWTIASSRRLTKERVGRVITNIGEEAGIVVQQEDPQTGERRKYASAHDLRRGCAQRLINAGVSAETLMVLMRHRSFATTQKYYGATRAAQSAAAEIYSRLATARDAHNSNEEASHLTIEELQKLRALLARI
jgi:integrase